MLNNMIIKENKRLMDLNEDQQNDVDKTPKWMESVARTHLSIDNLNTQNRDSKDFHDVYVNNVKRALEAAYNLGKYEVGRRVKLKSSFSGGHSGTITHYDPHENLVHVNWDNTKGVGEHDPSDLI